MPVKIKVSGFTILVAALAFFSHAAVPLGHIFFILALHESGHAFWAWFFHYPIRQLSILPFGLALTLEHFGDGDALSLIHISEPTRQAEISYAVFCLKKKKKIKITHISATK